MEIYTRLRLNVFKVYRLLESGCHLRILCSNNDDDSFSILSFSLMCSRHLVLLDLPKEWFELFKPFITFIWDGSFVHRCSLSLDSSFSSFRKAVINFC